MPECVNPLTPCAMTGAAAALAGFDGITVVIHGSSGCYYYPATLLHAPLLGTFIVGQDVIMGSEARLLEVVAEAAESGGLTAVVTSCVPAILGEDIRSLLSPYDVVLVESPGFAGSFATGYRNALAALAPRVDPGAAGINIDGICLLDPFSAGNIRELTRLLAIARVPVATVLCSDELSRLHACSPFTITADGDLSSGIGTNLGGTLGPDAVRETFRRIGDALEGSDPGPVFSEIDAEEERLIRACDKYLRRFDPPVTAIFSGGSYSAFAAGVLKKYLDAEIACIGTRTFEEIPRGFSSVPAPGLNDVTALIQKYAPDLVIGASFEKSVKGDAAFVGLTPPLRDRVRLVSRPVAGIAGTLSFMEEVLNACMDRMARR